MHGIEPIFFEFIPGVIRAVDRGHEVRVVGQQREKIKHHAPAALVGVGKIKSREQERCGPGAAAHGKVDPRAINPGALRRGEQGRRRRILLLRRSYGDGLHGIAEYRRRGGPGVEDRRTMRNGLLAVANGDLAEGVRIISRLPVIRSEARQDTNGENSRPLNIVRCGLTNSVIHDMKFPMNVAGLICF